MAAHALLGLVYENLLSKVQNEFATISRIKGKEKAAKLSDNLRVIQAAVEHAKQEQILSSHVQHWLQELKDAVYLLDDILDECSTKSLRLRGFSSFKPKNIMFHYEISSRLKEITRRFDEIMKHVSSTRPYFGNMQVSELGRQTISIDESHIYGRDDDKKRVVKFLLNQAGRSDHLSIYPIVGLGGVGKTTLAYLVFNDEIVKKNFSMTIWVCVSKKNSSEGILGSIIEAELKHANCDAWPLDKIASMVEQLLQNKRYLLVLDEVQGVEETTWKVVRSLLSCGSKGSCILVTTRNKKVAAIMGTCEAHYLAGLSKDQCWLLLKTYTFVPEMEELIAIGKEIINKCGGLPLAVRELANILQSASEGRLWDEAMELCSIDGIWTLLSQTFTTLKVSYYDLSPMSRECYTFCAIFPKDTEIMKEDIIHLWMANGFISSRDNLEVEDVGNMIWDELCQKLFFQDIKVDDSSGDISFKMHYLIHDLAQSIMGEECMILVGENMTALSGSTHHVSYGDPPKSYDGVLKKDQSLRTLYQLKLHGQGNILFFPLISSLRVIRTSLLKLPQLKNFIHLRYLELYGLAMDKLHGPFIDTSLESISTLQKLEILKLKHFSNLVCLPKQFTSLQNLRHLVIESCYSLSYMFPDLQKISSLRTLSVYIVSSKTGHNLAELHDLKIGGKLSLEGLENVDSLSDARDANLIGKKDLKNLSFSWYRRDIQDLRLSWYRSGETESPAINVEKVLEGLQPHSNLKRLRIHQYEGLHFPPWMVDMSNLVVLELHGCRNVLQLPSLGKLPSLRKLKICDMDNVRYMDDDDDEHSNYMEVKAFPSLEELSLRGLPKLEQLLKVGEGNMFPSLSDLNIYYCPKLVLPELPSLKSLQLYACNNEVLKSVSSFNTLTSLEISCGDTHLTSFPEGMMRNLASLETLVIYNFPRLKKITNELLCLYALKRLEIILCEELESLPEEGWKSLRYLSTLKFYLCGGLRSLPEGVRHLNSLEVMEI